MGKAGLTATKYIVEAKIDVDGVVEGPDVIGAVFGQTEGLLGDELELRELQKGGKVGRIEVKVTSSNGKSTGLIKIPTSLNRQDTALIAAALETIDRVGPCEAKITINGINDVRAVKRDFVVDRAKALLEAMGKSVPDSQALSQRVTTQARKAKIAVYGPDKLVGGPTVENASEIIIVEGRADVNTLLRHGIMNVLAVGGTNIPQSIKDVVKGKKVTAFLDGDRGGDLLLKELMQLIKVETVCRAPHGLEVEELEQKEIIKALRNKRAPGARVERPTTQRGRPARSPRPTYTRRPRDKPRFSPRKPRMPMKPKKTTLPKMQGRSTLIKIAENHFGAGGACLLKQSKSSFREDGKVPKSDLSDVLANLQKGRDKALVVDGPLDSNTISKASDKGIKYIIGASKPASYTHKPDVYVLDKYDLKRSKEPTTTTKPATTTKPTTTTKPASTTKPAETPKKEVKK